MRSLSTIRDLFVIAAMAVLVCAQGYPPCTLGGGPRPWYTCKVGLDRLACDSPDFYSAFCDNSTNDGEDHALAVPNLQHLAIHTAPTSLINAQQLRSLVDNLAIERATRPAVDRWGGVPLYVLTLGGPRFDQFKLEAQAQGQPFIRVPQPQAALETDYPIDESEMKCTRAHIAFAQELLKRGDGCALVAEDDASFGMSSLWPFSLRELCDGMFDHDPNWTSLMLYSHDGWRLPNHPGSHIMNYTEASWGSVAYLATQRWARTLLNVTSNNTRVIRAELGSLYGVADSAVYAFNGASGYKMIPSYIFPNNLDHGTDFGTWAEGRNAIHIRQALKVVLASSQHFRNTQSEPRITYNDRVHFGEN